MRTVRSEIPSDLTAIAMQAVAQTWAVVTGHPAEDALSFDEAGGDSLGLMEIVFVLEEVVGCKLPLDHFHPGLTISGFVDQALICLSGPAEPIASAAAPIFLCPAMYGDLPYLADFRRHCGDAMDFVTIDYGPWQDCLIPGFTLGTLVDLVVTAIEQRQPSGPVTIGGFSAGARLSFEVARVLESRGRAVKLLALLDAPAPGCVGADLEPEGAAPNRLRAWWWVMNRLYSARRDGTMTRRLGRLLAAPFVGDWAAPLWRAVARRSRPLRGNADLASLWHWIRHYIAVSRRTNALNRGASKVPPPEARLAGRTVLFRCAVPHRRALPDYGWDQFVRQLTVVPVAGNHYTMLTDHVAQTAAAFITAVQVSGL